MVEVLMGKKEFSKARRYSIVLEKGLKMVAVVVGRREEEGGREGTS